jgi:hypothetical protein
MILWDPGMQLVQGAHPTSWVSEQVLNIWDPLGQSEQTAHCVSLVLVHMAASHVLP